MIYTYLIKYNGIDGFGSIEFCAKSKKEAIGLFEKWCIEDNGMTKPKPVNFIEIVYNEEDAIEYGLDYGLMC